MKLKNLTLVQQIIQGLGLSEAQEQELAAGQQEGGLPTANQNIDRLDNCETDVVPAGRPTKPNLTVD